MNKKVMIYFIGLVWVAVLLQLVVMVGTRNDTKVVQAFQSVDSVPVKSIVTVSGTYKEYLVSQEEQEKLCRYIANGLSITSYKTKTTTKDGKNVITLSSSNKTAETEIVLREEENKQTITTTVTLNNKINSVIYIKEKMEKIYTKLKMEPVSSFSMEGSLPGEMSDSRRESIKQEIFKVLETKPVKKQEVSGSQVYYGFSQRLSGTKKMDNQKVNVQLIFSYNEEKEETSLYLAVPFYNQDF